jgi:hypothetical protein
MFILLQLKSVSHLKPVNQTSIYISIERSDMLNGEAQALTVKELHNVSLYQTLLLQNP